jgi:hypothetical protein
MLRHCGCSTMWSNNHWSQDPRSRGRLGTKHALNSSVTEGRAPSHFHDTPGLRAAWRSFNLPNESRIVAHPPARPAERPDDFQNRSHCFQILRVQGHNACSGYLQHFAVDAQDRHSARALGMHIHCGIMSLWMVCQAVCDFVPITVTSWKAPCKGH